MLPRAIQRDACKRRQSWPSDCVDWKNAGVTANSFA